MNKSKIEQMNQWNASVVHALLLGIIFFGAFAVARVHAQVSVKEFPAPNPNLHCYADDINEQGDVLVNCHTATGVSSRIPYIWSTSTDAVTEILISNSWCGNINNLGLVTCTGSLGSFLWSSAGGAVAISGIPFGLNDLGEATLFRAIAGCDNSTVSCLHLRRSDGTLIPVPTAFRLPGKLSTLGGTFGLNNNSQFIVTRVSDSVTGTWSPTLGFTALPGAPAGAITASFGFDLNDAGQAGGNLQSCVSCPFRGWRVTPGVGWEVLTHPSGYESAGSWAEGVDVLGGAAASIYWQDGSGEFRERAFYWAKPDSPIDLGDYLGKNTWAWRSNAANMIIGGAYSLDGSILDKALVWNIAPPPPPTPTQQIENIEDAIDGLVNSALIDQGDASGLQAKLLGATQALEQEAGAPAAAKILKAASNQVSALLKSKRISQTDADALQTLLNSAIAGL